MIKIDDESAEKICGDEIVWRYDVSRGVEFQGAWLTASARAGLVKAFGEEWLEQHLRSWRERLDRWQLTGINGEIH